MIKVKNIKPIFTSVITTAERYEEDGTVNGSTILDKNKVAGSYKEYQKVISVGSSVREVKPGDIVLINPTRYMTRKFNDNSLREDIVDNPVINVDIPTVQMNDEDFFLINENDVAYIITDYEELPEPKVSNLILPKKKNLIIN